MFRSYTGWQWLLIDAANNVGRDKDLFEDRIQWATDHLSDLESFIEDADNPALYHKAVLAIRRALKGESIGHMVGVDATCSGIQIMSCLTGCHIGAYNTGLINDNMRADAYTKCTESMIDILAGVLSEALEVSRSDAKTALMTSFYGSKAQPIRIFGENTPQLEAFYQAAAEIAPGAWELRQDLLDSWQPYALSHSWKLPDGFDVKVKVMKKIDGNDSRSRIEVDELDHATFTYEFYINEGEKRGKSNVANVTHSVDGFVLREMHRRCNHDVNVTRRAVVAMEEEVGERLVKFADTTINVDLETYNQMLYYIDNYKRSGMPSTVIIPLINRQTVKLLDDKHLAKLCAIGHDMLRQGSFPIITVHDEFKSHPNDVNAMRWHYKEILADVADSDMLNDILSQIYGCKATFTKYSQGTSLGDKIRQSSYGLC